MVSCDSEILRIDVPVRFLSDAPLHLDVVVHLLYVPPGELCQLDVADTGHHVMFDVVLVKFLCTFPDVRFGISLVPRSYPTADGIFLGPLNVYLRTFPNGLLQLLLDLRLSPAEDILAD